MSLAFAIKVILEVLVVVTIGFGILYEEEVIELENVLWQWIKRGCRKGRGNNAK